MYHKYINTIITFSLSLFCFLAGAIFDKGQADVIVGTPRVETAPQPAPSTVDELKAKYRRPSSIPFPKDNPYTIEKEVLGKKLFYDTRLSGAKALSCQSCHLPGYGWSDGRPRGIGDGMKELGRHSPTLINAAFGVTFGWDGRDRSIEVHSLGPFKNPSNMNLPLDQLIERLKQVSEYGALFKAAFPNEEIEPSTVAKALATYQRMLVSNRAPFDAWIEGDEKAISDDAKRGFALFNEKARCSACHGGWNFTDGSFHDIGLPGEDIGRGKLFPGIVKMQHAFKTPSLREITLRAPYMHGGSIATLERVIEHYDLGGIERESRSEQMKPLGLTAAEKGQLIAFLRTLTGDIDAVALPVPPR